MFRRIWSLFIIAETPVHAGSGSELGLVDLPIQRERYTDFPKIEGAGLKGCIREGFEGYRIFEDGKSKLIDSPKIENLKKKFNQITQSWTVKKKEANGQKIEKEVIDEKGNKLIMYDQAINLIFGPEGGDAHAGAITFTDSRILLFPVKSLKGIFAWITCPMVLERFRKELKMAGVDLDKFGDFSILQNTIPEQTNLVVESKIVLEEFTFEVKEDKTTSDIATWLADRVFPHDPAYNYWRKKLKKDMVILSDDDFRQFVRTSTEVITRTKIDDETGTVKSGALWTEEYLPQDTILYSLVMFTEPRVGSDEKKGIFKADSPQKEAELVAEFFKSALPEVIQIGGNQTIGKGLIRLNLMASQ